MAKQIEKLRKQLREAHKDILEYMKNHGKVDPDEYKYNINKLYSVHYKIARKIERCRS